ncbi:hypothetical protein NG895_07335 [Aeoliella sp. ICT_H6.2]|uniref:Uncharacterized protein n=1 Tax=Aeoliella straminimaris TaxID=2954799 RepID=A0A9X2FD94_9BACT|nr:hypothetical protein [Aeoliella straminimaris]MCO6043716.1 hypothetical protein [Aeoliella straminimaris]
MVYAAIPTYLRTAVLLACAVVAGVARSQPPAVGPDPTRAPTLRPAGPRVFPNPVPRSSNVTEVQEDDEFALPDVLDPTPGPIERLGPDFRNPNGVPARQAIDRPAPPRATGQYQVRLTQAPKMLGDFFSNTNNCIIVGQQYGMAVHQAVGSGSIGAADNLRMIYHDAGSDTWVFAGGSNNTAQGTYFTPSLDAPLEGVITGLSGNGLDQTGNFTAVDAGEVIDVFDNDTDTLASMTGVEAYQIFEVNKLVLPAANPGDLVGRVRIQDNNSALPQDRVYLDYNYFHNARFTDAGFGVNRLTPGIERTFWGGMASIECRIPVAATLNSETTFGEGFDTSNVEWGNLTIAPKVLLWVDDQQALAAGLGIALPTADDLEIFSTAGPALMVRNDAVHVIPYLAYLRMPQRSDFFVHSFLTVDVDTGGNEVWANTTGAGLQQVGGVRDQTLLTASASLGKFVYRNFHPGPGLKGLAWTTELHYTATLDDADVVQAGPFQVGTPDSDLSLLNATVGGHLFAGNSILTAGYTVPVNSDERVFDGEFRFFINRLY